MLEFGIADAISLARSIFVHAAPRSSNEFRERSLMTSWPE